MEDQRLKYNDKIIAILMKIFIFISIVFPFITRYDAKNTNIILSNLVCFVIIIISIFRKNVKDNSRKFLMVFSFLIIIYNITCGYYNLYFHHYYIEQFNKNISFILLIIALKKFDEEFFVRNQIIQFLFISIFITCILSILYYFWGGDALIIENFRFTLRRQGMFEDNRLTWVYGHKSVYGLMLSLYLFTIIKYSKIFTRKISSIFLMLAVVFTIFLSGSSTTLGLVSISILFIIVSRYQFRKRPMVSFFLILFMIIISYFALSFIYNYISNVRDISTVGNRTFIYQAAKFYLGIYPEGIGKMFGNISLLFANMDVDNLHNIFLNEMLRFSIVVGVIYTIIFCVVAFYTIVKNKFWAIGIWITCFGLFFMDYSLTTEFLTLFFFIIYLLFFIDKDKFFSIMRLYKNESK